VGVVEKEDPVMTGFTFPSIFGAPDMGGGVVGKVLGSFGSYNNGIGSRGGTGYG
jgi:hypothetical protein